MNYLQSYVMVMTSSNMVVGNMEKKQKMCLKDLSAIK